MTNQICRHPLRLVAHAPAWLSCDVHRADFPHHRDCPGYGTPGCITLCANGEPDDEQLLGMAVELLEKTPRAYDLVGPCGAIPRDLARALILPLNHAYGHAASSSGVADEFTAELVAVARALLGRATDPPLPPTPQASADSPSTDRTYLVSSEEKPAVRDDSAARPAPATDQAELRDRIARVLAGTALKPPFPHCLAAADAVLAMLPAPVDQATVRANALREAADRYARLTDRNEAYDREQGQLDETARLQHGAVRDVAVGLRRMADETQPKTSGEDSEVLAALALHAQGLAAVLRREADDLHQTEPGVVKGLRLGADLIDPTKGAVAAGPAVVAQPAVTNPSVITDRVLSEILAERIAQDAQWGEQNHPDGTNCPGDADSANMARRHCQQAADGGTLAWRHVMTEEWTEARAESDPAKLRAELVQVAGVAVAWIEAIDRRATRQGDALSPQHVGGNAEDCPACSGSAPEYPFTCPGPGKAPVTDGVDEDLDGHAMPGPPIRCLLPVQEQPAVRPAAEGGSGQPS